MIDENTAKLFSHATDRPVVKDGSVLFAGWLGRTASTAAVRSTGKFDRLYAHPIAAG